MSSESGRPQANLFSPSREKARLLLLGLGSFAVFAAGIGMRALWNPNEPVYAEGVREMVARGDFFLPYVNGIIYSDKPILYFWAMLAACKLTGGLSEWALRLPSVLSGVLSVLMVYRFGRQVFGIRAGFLAAASLATTVMFWWHSQYIQMDQMLSFLMLAALVLFFAAREFPGPRSTPLLIASGAMMGLAFATKGPVGVVVPAAVMGLYLVLVKEWRWIFSRPVLWMGAACALFAVPWFAGLALAGHRDVLVDFFIRHNLVRATDPFNHQQPFWYYGPRLLSDLFPWSLFLPIAWFAPVRNELERRGRVFLRVWLGAVFLLFSAAGAKRGVYLLPLYPAAALLIGKFWDEVLDFDSSPLRRRWTRAGLVFLAGFFGLAFLGALGVAGWARHSGKYQAEALWLVPLGILGLGTATGVALGLRRRRWIEAVAAVAVGLASICLYSGLFVFRLADRYKSPVPFCRHVLRQVPPEDELRSYGLWRWDSSYIYYTGRLMPQVRSREDLEAYLAQPRRAFLLVESSELDRFVGALRTPVRVVVRQDIGHKTTALLVNRPETAAGAR